MTGNSATRMRSLYWFVYMCMCMCMCIYMCVDVSVESSVRFLSCGWENETNEQTNQAAKGHFALGALPVGVCVRVFAHQGQLCDGRPARSCTTHSWRREKLTDHHCNKPSLSQICRGSIRTESWPVTPLSSDRPPVWSSVLRQTDAQTRIP